MLLGFLNNRYKVPSRPIAVQDDSQKNTGRGLQYLQGSSFLFSSSSRDIAGSEAAALSACGVETFHGERLEELLWF